MHRYEYVTWYVTELLHDFGREDARGERAPEHGGKLGVETADAELLEVPVRVDDWHVRVLPKCTGCKLYVRVLVRVRRPGSTVVYEYVLVLIKLINFINYSSITVLLCTDQPYRSGTVSYYTTMYSYSYSYVYG